MTCPHTRIIAIEAGKLITNKCASCSTEFPITTNTRGRPRAKHRDLCPRCSTHKLEHITIYNRPFIRCRTCSHIFQEGR